MTNLNDTTAKRSLWVELSINPEIPTILLFVLLSLTLRYFGYLGTHIQSVRFGFILSSLWFIVNPNVFKTANSRDILYKAIYLLYSGLYFIINEIIFITLKNIVNSIYDRPLIKFIPIYSLLIGVFVIIVSVFLIAKRKEICLLIPNSKPIFIRACALFWLVVNALLSIRAFYLVKAMRELQKPFAG